MGTCGANNQGDPNRGPEQHTKPRPGRDASSVLDDGLTACPISECLDLPEEFGFRHLHRMTAADVGRAVTLLVNAVRRDDSRPTQQGSWRIK